MVQKNRSKEKNSKRPPALLTVGDVASLLNLHPNTVRRWAGQGILKALRVGPRRDRRFYRADISRLLRVSLKGSVGDEAESSLRR
ncbi:MAG: helix-turn-helix domain-containing protein [Chloroflexi bacterium]|nr:helix-turn-helix domain-containing protein [Chloroflexota bacterium]